MKKIALFGMLFAVLVSGCTMEDTDQLPPDEDDVDLVVDDGQVEGNQDDNDDEELPVQVADFDNDSVQNPAVEYFMSPTGTRVFNFTNDISFPEGDSEDFVEFSLPNNSNSSSAVWITLDCAIDGPEDTLVEARIWEDGVESANKVVACNDGEQQVTINNTKVQTVRVYFLSVSDAAYADYTLTVKSTLFL